MSSLFSTLGFIIGLVSTIFVTIWAILRFIVFQSYRLDDNTSKIIIKNIKDSESFKFELSDEYSNNKKFPVTYQIFTFLNNIPIYFSRNERMLNAGWQSKDVVSEIFFIRWTKKKIDKYLNTLFNNNNLINVMVLLPSGTDKLGDLKATENSKIYLNKKDYEDIENDVKKVIDTSDGKTGCLLYGKPGMGKTRFVKYLSAKYMLPIYSIYLNPDYNNLDILTMFGSIPERCIVLFEDFDNYFNKRDCILKNDKVKFTFDSILNGLDGVYNDYKGVVFIMTVNDISKVDESIKHRSSRFKFVREIKEPTKEIRMEILQNHELVELTEGMSLDKVFFTKDLKDSYDINEIKEKINIDI